MQFAEKPLESVIIGVAKDGIRAVTLVRTALNQTVAPEKGKASSRRARHFKKRGETMGAQAVAKIKINFFPPCHRLAGWGLKIRSLENRRSRVSQRRVFEY